MIMMKDNIDYDNGDDNNNINNNYSNNNKILNSRGDQEHSIFWIIVPCIISGLSWKFH